MKTYVVFHRRSMTHPGFKAPTEVSLDDYVFVATLEAQDLEDVFRKMNVVDGTELPVRLKVRSLSVGDVVDECTPEGDPGRSWYCASFGWEEVRWLPLGE